MPSRQVGELAVAHIEVPHAAHGLRTEANRGPLRLHAAVGNGEVLVGPVRMQRLRTDRVVAAIEITATDAHMSAAVEVEAIAVAGLAAANGDTFDGDVLAMHEEGGEGCRIPQRHIAHGYGAAVLEPHQHGPPLNGIARIRKLLVQIATLAIHDASTCHPNLLGILRIDQARRGSQREGREGLAPFERRRPQVVVPDTRATPQRGSFLHLQDDAAFQLQ